ncbi:phosphatase PAP2 family protein [Streptomyces sp. NPDC053048]|uniref:phosphatase PAP2 family protein n=1 Tax=Streptomyces sp. NPDC053048 TaxID=3365694 RepID=UPI0037D8567D
MNETPRPQGTAGDAAPVRPQCRPGRAFAHTTGALGSGHPHRSDGRPPQTPRGARCTGRHGGPGTIPPVPGPPTTFLAFLAFFPALCAVLLALVTWQVAAHGPLRALDERLGRAVAASGALPSAVAEFLADLGNTVVALPVLAVAIAVCAWRERRWRRPCVAVLAMAAVPALVVPLKMWIGRPGPPAMAGGGHDGFFPSGHAATAAVAYGAAVLLLVRSRWWVGLCLLLNAGVGAGLVLRGYHWPLDVVGAWCLAGVVLSGAARWVGCAHPFRPAERLPTTGSPSAVEAQPHPVQRPEP